GTARDHVPHPTPPRPDRLKPLTTRRAPRKERRWYVKRPRGPPAERLRTCVTAVLAAVQDAAAANRRRSRTPRAESGVPSTPSVTARTALAPPRSTVPGVSTGENGPGYRIEALGPQTWDAFAGLA